MCPRRLSDGWRTSMTTTQRSFMRAATSAAGVLGVREKKPTSALHRALDDAGALYVLAWNFAELGRYCGALALGRASGTVDAALRVPAPRVSVNRRAAQQLRLKWDAASLAGVTNVHD